MTTPSNPRSAFPVIPTCELQIGALCSFQSGEWTVGVVNYAVPADATKTAAGLHLVFRYLPSFYGGHKDVTPPRVLVSFPGDNTSEVLLPLCGSNSFIESGIILAPGDFVTLEVASKIGATKDAPVGLAFRVQTIPAPPPPATGVPNDPVILIAC
ncbi:MAG: hypothetical protein KIT83_08720 [Bryobacterales bacterium]|nr:hypothetical protein [Bryobacterales bacterium]